MQKPERSAYTTIDLLGWANDERLEISPRFQRRGVWKRPARSFLIDTLILGYPVPPVYVRIVKKPGSSAAIREIVDGQQRVSAVLDFVNGKYSLSNNIESPYVGCFYGDLPTEAKEAIENYSFLCEVFYGVDDREILSVFARLNTHSVRLNAQELRNGKFFGPFKRCAYDLSLSHLTYWRNNRIFTETAIARMQEVELTSELMIALMAGMQDKKKAIDTFYERFDNEFAERGRVETKFRRVIDELSEAVGDLSKSQFRRTPLFYSLFLTVAHQLYGIPGVNLPRRSSDKLNAGERQRLFDTVTELDDVIETARSGGEIKKEYATFVTAALQQTDNIRPRTTRLSVIYGLAFI